MLRKEKRMKINEFREFPGGPVDLGPGAFNAQVRFLARGLRSYKSHVTVKKKKRV